MNMAIAFSQPLSPRPFDTLKPAKVLVQQHLISPSQREQVLVLQQKTGKKTGRLLVEAGWITEDTLAQGLACQLNTPLVNLKTHVFKADAVKLLPEAVARRCRAWVVDDLGGSLQVVFVDPLDLVAFDELTRFLKRGVTLAIAPENQLAPAFDRLYRRTDEIIGLARALEKDLGEAVDFGALSATVGLEAALVVRLLQSIFEDAVQAGASDVHIEPQKSGLQIRVRVDGLLQRQTRADKKMGAALAQRLKLMAGLDISEKRRPQDGRFSVRLKEHTLDVRLSTLPTAFGESVVMRLLDHSGAKL